MVSPHLSVLSVPDRELLEAWLVVFDESWNDQALAAQASRLKELPEHVRAAALLELVKIDLERQWQRGSRVTLDTYLRDYPALGTAESVSAELVQAEYEVRRQFHGRADLDEFAERFPHQEQELRRLLAEAETARSRASSAPVALPPQADRDTSKAALSTDGGNETQPTRKIPREFGRYRITKRLGEGGMGAVYLAHDTQLDRQVALKIPRFSAKKKGEIVDRFFREARAAATIRHPNVCPVYDVGEIEGIHYLTMAYIQGHTLSEFIRPGRPLPERQVAAVVCKLAIALQEAHDCGVVHRDLKPSNVMIDRKNEPVIMDFGLARRTDNEESRATQRGTILGTPAYMSPEQVLGDPDQIGPHTDVYSLGVILYELLTGRVPYQGAPTAVIGQILGVDPPAPEEHREDLDPKLAAICSKAMSKKREGRYGSMKELASDLTKYLAHARKAPAKPATGRASQDAAGQDSMEQAFANIAASGMRTARRSSPKPLAKRLQQLAPLARRHRKTLVAIGAGFFFLFLCGVIITIKQGDRTVTVEDPAPGTTFKVSDDGEDVSIQPPSPSSTETVESASTNPPPSDWQTWSRSLMSAGVLDSFYCTSGQYGPYHTWLLAKVVEGEGIKIHGGHTPTALWARVCVGNSYHVSLEAMQGHKSRDARVRLLLGGPGYGNSEESSYCVVVKDKVAVLMREGIECCAGPLPSPTEFGRWIRLDARVDGGDIQLLIDGIAVLQYTDPAPLSGPLHAWVGFVGRDETWYRNLRISAPELNESGEKELLPAASSEPVPNGPTIYELTMDQETVEQDWWLSRPEAVHVKNGSLDLRGFNSLSQLILDHPLRGNVAMEAEIEYPSPETLNFQMAFWAADKLPEAVGDRVGGWFALVSNYNSNLSIQWHDKEVGCGWVWIPKSRPLAKTPYYAPIRGRRYVARLEAVGDRARLFLDGHLILNAQRPRDAKGKDLPLYAAVGQMYAPVFVHSLRIYQLDEKAEQSLPKTELSDRRAAEWVLRMGGWVCTTTGAEQIHRVADLPDAPFLVSHVNLRMRPELTTEGLQQLEGLTALKVLELAANPQIRRTATKYLGSLKSLTLLELGDARLTDEGVQRLAGLEGLEHLLIWNTGITDASLEVVAKMKALKRLSAGTNQITGKGLTHLRSLTSLETLTLPETQLTDEDLKLLAAFPKLHDLDLSHTLVTNAGLTHLKTLDRLESLRLRGLPISDKGLAQIAELNKEILLDLELSDTKITDQGLQHLGDFKPRMLMLDANDIKGPGLDKLDPERLVNLALRHTPIDDTGIKHLARMANLTHLALDGTAITDSALDVVGKLDKLQGLSLIGTGVTDTGLEELTNLKKLGELLLHDTQVTATGVERLQAALPTSRILWDASTKTTAPTRPGSDAAQIAGG